MCLRAQNILAVKVIWVQIRWIFCTGRPTNSKLDSCEEELIHPKDADSQSEVLSYLLLVNMGLLWLLLKACGVVYLLQHLPRRPEFLLMFHQRTLKITDSGPLSLHLVCQHTHLRAVEQRIYPTLNLFGIFSQSRARLMQESFDLNVQIVLQPPISSFHFQWWVPNITNQQFFQTATAQRLQECQ